MIIILTEMTKGKPRFSRNYDGDVSLLLKSECPMNELLSMKDDWNGESLRSPISGFLLHASLL